MFSGNIREHAAMAQLVEHILGKDEVPGPNPGSSSRQPRCSNECRGFGFIWALCTITVRTWGCRELLLSLWTVLCAERRIRFVYPDRSLQACLQSAGRGYLRLGEYPGSSRQFSLRLGHLRGKTVINCFLTPSGRCATRR